MVVGGGPLAPTVILLSSVFLSGCIEVGGDDPPSVENPAKRLARMSGGGGGEWACGPTHIVAAPLGQAPCVEGQAELLELRCTPPQLLGFTGLVPIDELPTHRTADAPPDAYLYCEYQFVWQVAAYTVMPGQRLEVTGTHQGEAKNGACDVTPLGSCAISDHLRGSFLLDGPDQSTTIDATVSATLYDTRGLIGASGALTIDIDRTFTSASA